MPPLAPVALLKPLEAQLPNQFNKIAILTDTPSKIDYQNQGWFTDGGGRYLRGLLTHLRVNPAECYINGIWPTPIDQSWLDIKKKVSPLASVNQQTVNDRWAQIVDHLATIQPNIIIVFAQDVLARLLPNAPGTLYTVRGYVFPIYTLPFKCKVICAIPPGDVMGMPKNSFSFRHDITKAIRNANSPVPFTPNWSIISALTFDVAKSQLEQLIARDCAYAFDIEGWANSEGVKSISFAWSETQAFAIPFTRNGASYWSIEQEAVLWRLVSILLNDKRRLKIFHNGAYETFVLQWKHACVCSWPYADTYIMWHEAHVEMEKSLGFVASVLLDIPYWKDDRGSTDVGELLNYNAIDSIATYRIFMTMRNFMPVCFSQHAKEMHVALAGYNYMCLRGVRFDHDRLHYELDKAEKELQPVLDQLQCLVGREINPKSNPDKNWLLYDHLRYAPDAKHGATSKEVVILRHWARTRDPKLQLLLQAVWARTRISDCRRLVTNADGRLRTTMNLAATVTWRANSAASNAQEIIMPKTARGKVKEEEAGTNLQNITKDLRACAVADEGYLFWQLDLAGADAWTVAADLASCGFPCMLDDLLAGIKPAKVLLLMLQAMRNGQNPATINALSRDELKRLTKALDTDNTLANDYLCMKRIQHGTNYTMGPDLCSEVIFKDSEGKVYLPPNQALVYQNFYRMRYNSDARIALVAERLRQTGKLQTGVGCFRQFYNTRGRCEEHDVVSAAVAFEPQANTTGVINRALCAMITDPMNRRKNGALFVEPLLQIHDALAGQFPAGLLDFARERLYKWFDQPIVVSGIQIRIPFEGHFGPNWKDQPGNI